MLRASIRNGIKTVYLHAINFKRIALCHLLLIMNCICITDKMECGNCARHCPAGAIQMVPSDPEDEASIKIPVVNAERCIGCGACENLCPSRPFSAILCGRPCDAQNCLKQLYHPNIHL